MRQLPKQQRAPLISIIVPVYQVKEYIGECVESLLAQTYEDLEIILVDDGSTDGSGEICDRYAAGDDRIRVVHQENQGPSAARNAGLDCAGGEYIAFVDSDDVVTPDFIEILYKLSRKYQADIAACAFVKCSTENLTDVKNELLHSNIGRGKQESLCEGDELRRRQTGAQEKEKVVCMSSEQMLRQWHGKYKMWETVVWNKLYQKRVFDGGTEGAVRFPAGRKLEDVLTSHIIAENARRFVLTMRKLYLYRIRSDSRASQSRTVELMGRISAPRENGWRFLRRNDICGRI